MASREEIVLQILDLKGDRIDLDNMQYKPNSIEDQLMISALEEELIRIDEADFAEWKAVILAIESENLLQLKENKTTA